MEIADSTKIRAKNQNNHIGGKNWALFKIWGSDKREYSNVKVMFTSCLYSQTEQGAACDL